MTAGPQTVVLAHAGTQFLHALRDSSRNLGPRVREDDGLTVSAEVTR